MNHCSSCGAPPSSKAEPGICLVSDPFQAETCAYCGEVFNPPRPKAEPNSWLLQQQRQVMSGLQSAFAGSLGAQQFQGGFGSGSSVILGNPYLNPWP